ncbi:hypothetical protein [Citricoccus sp.]|uniref:hypothetical protein n=1 Tax=Citricoccus sp. TaxID=1978372 RepID=UPI0028BF1388|nr:hypothetical protein [Citricoccus sp.]
MSIAPDSSATATTGGPGSGLRLSSWDVAFLASVLVVLAGSIVPLTTSRWGLNLWGTTNLFFLGVGILMPLVAAGFILARAASAEKSTGDAGPRLGSLSTDQFAHVTAWLALSYFFITFVTTLDPVLLIGLAGAFGLLVTSPMRSLTAPLFAGSIGATGRAATAGPDRRGNPGNPTGPGTGTGAGSNQDAEYGQAPAYGQAASQEAHEEYRSSPEPSASPEPSPGGDPQSATDPDEELGMTRVRPRSTNEAAASATAAFGAPAAAEPSDVTDSSDPSDPSDPSAQSGSSDLPAASASVRPSLSSPVPQDQHTAPIDPLETGPSAPRGTEPAEYEAFWFAVGTRRTAVNPEDGSPAFGLEPGGWILALEDRGHEFLVQNTDGRTGVLEDLTDIERA